MLSHTNSQVQVYSRLIKIGEEYVVQYAEVQTININTIQLALPDGTASHAPTFSSEYYLLMFLLCLLPILILMAFIYGKRMGQREKVSVKNPKDENILEKLTISQKSTKETSSPTSDREMEGSTLPEELENLPPSISYNNSKSSSQSEKEEKSSPTIIPQMEHIIKEESHRKESTSCRQSFADERSQESWRSSIVDETQTLDIIRNDINDLNGLHAVISYDIDPSKAGQNKYPIPTRELISLHRDESQVKHRRVKFGVSTEMENGRLVKKETVETITTYEKDAVDPELNAQALKRGISNISNASQTSLPLQIKAEEISEPEESPILNNKVSIISAGKSDSESCVIATAPNLSQKPSENKSEPLPIMPYVPDNSKILALLESEDLPDETGKFNKVFKDPVLIGEGSFGAVYKVTHRLDSKLYAVKKIKLRLKKHDDLQKRSKVLREVFAISNLQHPNIVRYSTCWVEIESSKKASRATSKPADNSRRLMSPLKAIAGSPSIRKRISEPIEAIEESSMAFEFESRPEEETQQEETVEGDITFEKSQPFMMEKSISETLVDDDVPVSSYPTISELTSAAKFSYFGEYDLYLYIQMEFCAGQNLRDYLDAEGRKIERRKILKMFKKLLQGVNAIHKCGILHRDLKPANIFLDDNENVKIGDFGLASLSSTEESTGTNQLNLLTLNLERSHSMMVGTPMYSSPEQEKGKKYNSKTDVYSLGLILCEMLNEFSTSHERYLFFNKIKKEYSIPEEFKNKFHGESDLIIRMTAESPDERPTVEETISEIDKLLNDETY